MPAHVAELRGKVIVENGFALGQEFFDLWPTLLTTRRHDLVVQWGHGLRRYEESGEALASDQIE